LFFCAVYCYRSGNLGSFWFTLTGLIEEWDILGVFTIHGPLALQAMRPLSDLPFAIAYFLDFNSFYYWHVLLILALIIKVRNPAISSGEQQAHQCGQWLWDYWLWFIQQILCSFPFEVFISIGRLDFHFWQAQLCGIPRI